MRWIPWEEIEARWMKEPGYAERMEAASRWLDEEVAKYGTIANPKPTPRLRPLFTRPKTKRTLRSATHHRQAIEA